MVISLVGMGVSLVGGVCNPDSLWLYLLWEWVYLLWEGFVTPDSLMGVSLVGMGYISCGRDL